MISDEIINEVRERTDIVRIVGQVVALKKAGVGYKGLCPFHDEKSPSFTVSPTRNTYHCFGCGAHGDAIRFLTENGARSFPEAVRELAAEVGLEVPEARPQSPAVKAAKAKKKTEEERLFHAQDALCAYYTDQLFGESGQRARAYLEDRGIEPETARAFRLGWAGGNKTDFARWMIKKNVQNKDLAALGVLLPPDEGRSTDDPLHGGYLRFRQRLMFPIIDFRSRVTGFSGRILDSTKKTAKYINSPETPIFTKGLQLYGAHTAKSQARKAGRLILCEGNVDVVMLWQAGFKGTAAAMGTALTAQQVRLCKRLSDAVVCVMDGDAAGAKAAFTSLVPFLDAGLQPRAVMLPTGQDPDSYVREFGAQSFGELIDSAPPLLDLFIDRTVAEFPADPPGRSAAVRQLAPALARLDDALTLDLYRTRVANALSVEPAWVDRAVAMISRAEAQITPTKTPSTANSFDPPPPFDGPPAWLDTEFAPPAPPAVVLEESLGNQGLSQRVEPIKVPRYVEKFVEIILQFPEKLPAIDPPDVAKYLTHPGLAAFVSRLYAGVEQNSVLNIDRLLAEEDDSALIAFLWERRSKSALPAATIDEAMESVIKTLRTKHYLGRRLQLMKEHAHARADAERCKSLKLELEAVHQKLQDLRLNAANGAH